MFAPRVSAKAKAVTSGRLTGAVKADTKRRTPKSRPEAAYSLYSEDAEEQVATLHKGLDRCAVLLSDILQCDSQGTVPKQDRSVKDGGIKCRPYTPTGKKAIRRSLSRPASNPRSAQTIHRKSSTRPAASTTPLRSPAPPHSGVRLHSSVRKPHLQKTPSKPLCPAVLPPRSPPAPDHVPERDLGPGSEVDGRMRRVQGLLGELRTLMAGHGGSAQTYLCLLEQTVSSALGSEASNNPSDRQQSPEELKDLQKHNTQLQSELKVLKQQLQDQEATQQLLNSQVSSLQVQLSASEKELSLVRNALQEAESQKQNHQQENIRLKTELESSCIRLRVTLQDKLKLEEKLRQKQQEIEGLHRIIDSCDSSTPTPDKPPACPPGVATAHIAQYLMSLEQNRPTRPSLQLPGPQQGPERDVESVISDWSVRSESSFNTRDEAAFRDGLAALDASIASLQKTLKLDLVKT